LRNLPNSLKLRQEKIREETLSKIQYFIDELNAEGYIITIKDLIDRTGYSRSLFQKPHVQELLKKNEIGKYRNTKIITEKVDESIREKAFRLEDELLKMNNKIEKLQQDKKENNGLINELKVKLHEKSEECEILRGELHILMQKAKILGFDLKLKENKK
jgi:hypothetical protein